MSKSTTRVQSGKNSIYIIGAVVIATTLLLWLVLRAQPAQDNTTANNEQNAQVQISQTQNVAPESQPAQAEAALPVQSEVAAAGTVGTEEETLPPILPFQPSMAILLPYLTGKANLPLCSLWLTGAALA